MGPNIIRYSKKVAMPVDLTRTPTKTKAEVFLEILDHPPISVRSHRDDVIKFNGDKEEPRLIWNEEVLTIMDESQLRMLLTFIENRTDAGTKQH